MREITHAAWKQEARDLFGDNSDNWRFVCPVCGHVARVKDWEDVGAPGAIAFSCVGRWIEGSKEAFEEKGEGPCNYAGGGLFRLNPVRVTREDGEAYEAFEFAAKGEER